MLSKTFIVGDIHGRRAQLHNIMQMIPRDESFDTLVFLGDLIDRGADAPGVVSDVIELQRAQRERVITLRGNHEQMLLDCIDDGARIWFAPMTGGVRTYEQYTNSALHVGTEDDFNAAQKIIADAVPSESARES